MQVKLDILATDTIFTFEGKEYQKCASTRWSPVGANLTESDYFGPKDPYGTIMQCAPKIGGQFQKNIRVWFSKDTIVSVN